MDVLDFYDDLDLIELINTVNSQKRRKHYRQRSDPFVTLDDTDFKKKYRFSKVVARHIIEIVANDIGSLERRGGKISRELQVLACLHFWGQGEKQDDCSDLHGFSQPTMSIVSKRVSTALAKRACQYIQMPISGAEQGEVMEGFRRKYNMPIIIGAIDCTQVKIKKVSGSTGQYYINTKGFHSINVQVICDSDLLIRDIVARWPGGTHNSKIFQESRIKQRFESNKFQGHLLGDSEYPTEKYLLTPVPHPTTLDEEKCNKIHIHTRNCVTKCLEMWNERFRCLHKGMLGSLDTTKTIIVALAVLHNIAIRANDFLIDDDIDG